MHDPSRALLERVAEWLAPLAAYLVYVGGCAAGLLITDTGAAGSRPTFDVDALVHVASYADYDRLAIHIRACGFTEAMGDTMLCRWRRGSLSVDVMPTDAAHLGFTNRCYAEAHATWVPPGTRDIRLITAPYFLASKFEAFHDRGRADVRGSHDLEAIVAVIDGRGGGRRSGARPGAGAVRARAGAAPTRHTHIPRRTGRVPAPRRRQPSAPAGPWCPARATGAPAVEALPRSRPGLR
jgi:hypothetical protein